MTDIASEADVLRKRLSDMGQRCSELEAERDTALMGRIMADGEIARLRVDVSRVTQERDEARGLAVKHVRTVERLRIALDPRRWTDAHHAAWHKHIPNTMAAFAALREIGAPARATDSRGDDNG